MFGFSSSQAGRETYVVGLLVDLVADHVGGGLGAGAEGGVAVFGDVLVGFFGRGRAGALDGLRDVVCGVPGGDGSVSYW